MAMLHVTGCDGKVARNVPQCGDNKLTEDEREAKGLGLKADPVRGLDDERTLVLV